MEAHHTGVESEPVGVGIGYAVVVGIDQAVADSDQAGADSDQAGADCDQTVADSNQAGADGDQAVVGTGCVGDTWS